MVILHHFLYQRLCITQDSLGKSDPPIRAPLALEDGFGSLGSGSNFMTPGVNGMWLHEWLWLNSLIPHKPS